MRAHDCDRKRHRRILIITATCLLLAACMPSHKTPAPESAPSLALFPVVDGQQAKHIEALDKVPEGFRVMHDDDGSLVVIRTRPIIRGRDIAHAEASLDKHLDIPVVAITLTDEAAKVMRSYTREHVGDRMATLWITPSTGSPAHWRLIQAATIQGIFGKRFLTTGLDSVQAASRLADALNRLAEQP